MLLDLIPSNYVDIHSHLLPGIDDGAPNIETTQVLINALQKIGFSEFITTPHCIELVWPNTENSIVTLLYKTKDDLNKLHCTPKLNAAAEYMMDGTFLKSICKKQLLTLKDNFVLVEMSYINAPLHLYDTLFELQLNGYQPILAHPERYAFYHANHFEFNKLKDAGCLFQLNLLSSVGYYGADVAKTADYLLQNKMIDFVGSDVHHQKHIAAFSEKIILKNYNNLPQLLQNNDFFKSK